MRQYTILSVLLLFAILSGCTRPPVEVSFFCDGRFVTTEKARLPHNATASITGRNNVRADATIDLWPDDTMDRDGTITVRGTTEDICADGSVSYTGPSGPVTVNLPKAGLKATAPATAYAAQDGRFTYPITIECCPGTTGRHNVSLEMSMSVKWAAGNRSPVVCSDNTPITIEGEMANVGSGWVKVTIATGGGRTCVLETTIARDH